MTEKLITQPSPTLPGVRPAKVLEALSPVHHTVLYVRVGLGWTVERTAQAMGIAPDAVRLMQHRALRKLCEELCAAS